jgi:hypothetical protein
MNMKKTPNPNSVFYPINVSQRAPVYGFGHVQLTRRVFVIVQVPLF